MRLPRYTQHTGKSVQLVRCIHQGARPGFLLLASLAAGGSPSLQLRPEDVRVQLVQRPRAAARGQGAGGGGGGVDSFVHSSSAPSLTGHGQQQQQPSGRLVLGAAGIEFAYGTVLEVRKMYVDLGKLVLSGRPLLAFCLHPLD
jgi:hypothetical protein